MSRTLNPDLTSGEAARIRRERWIDAHPEWHRPHHGQAKLHRLHAPFAAVDGEGGGKDSEGRQRYLLLRAGNALLFRDNTDLTTTECLEFLSLLDHKPIYIGYYFDYDVTMILRHTTLAQRDRILRPVMIGMPTERRATYIGNYEVEYVPHKYFKVKHINQKQWVTINEVGSFFQMSFAKAIRDWETGTAEERMSIIVNKLRRDTFEDMTATEIEYNKIECRHLEELMTTFREVCSDTSVLPARWQGPGYLASDLLKSHSIPKRKEYSLDPELLSYANSAYYGGRFELLKVGTVRNVHEYDINSAYPHAMRILPCLLHGAWNYGRGMPDRKNLYVAFVQFKNTGCALANLPIRDKKSGTISWPYEGRGWYWSTEIEAALRSGKTRIVEWIDHWDYHHQCDCRPFDWINNIYMVRQSLGKSTRGYPLKLAINSLYGKTAQSVGSASYANPIWAGLITSSVRASLIDAYDSVDSREIVMLATDGIYSRVPLPHLTIGAALGQWELKHHAEMFLVQPGIYFSSEALDRPKTRGVALAVVLKYETMFREVFAQWLKDIPVDIFGNVNGYPRVCMPMTHFIGLKLAQSWNKPWLAGKWQTSDRHISFDFSSKRVCAVIDKEAQCIHTLPKPGSPHLVTTPYSRAIGAWREEAAELAALLGDQPDLFPYAPADQELL